VALKKPSDIFNKTEPSGVFNTPEVSSDITETYDKFRSNLDKVNVLSEQIEQLSQQLSEKITRTDLENAMFSQVMVLDENFKSIRNQVKGLNKEDLKEFKVNISNLTEIVENLVENELPKYRKQVTKNEVVVDEKINEFIVGIRNEIDAKVNDIAEVIDTNLEYFNNQLQETSFESKNTSDTYNKLSKIVENRISKENEKLEEYSQVIQSLHEAFIELEKSFQEETSTYNQIIEEKFANISSDVNSTIHSIDENVNNKINSIDEDVDTFKNQVSSDISSIKADVVIFEKHNKDTEKTIQEFSEQLYKISEIDTNIININEDIGKLQNQYDSISNQSIETKKDLEVVERYIQNHHRELVELKEEVFGEIEQIPVGNLQENLERLEKKIDYIKETYSKIEPEVIVKEVIKEGLLNEPPDAKNSDPLTPLDQKFVTLDQLQKHYSLFINRIQQQLSTLGGGGETRLKYLDDIVGIATNASAYDGKYLKYNHSLRQFEFSDVDISNDSWADGDLGPYTLSSVGIGTTIPTSKLDVRGDVLVSGVSTFGNTVVGGGTTQLIVNGDARITGILTIGTSSLTLDGTNNQIIIGTGVTIRESGSASFSDGLIVSGVSTLGTVKIFSGIITATSGIVTYYGDGSKLQGIVSTAGVTVLDEGSQVGTSVTTLNFVGSTISVSNAVNGISTVTVIGSNTATFATTAGIATFATTAGIATFATTAGIATFATTAGIATFATTAGISTSIIGGIGSITQLQVTGISTFNNGPIFIGAATSTGTASQPLQVTGGAYVSGNLGIGSTNPAQKLHVVGNVRITGGIYDSNNNVGSASSVLTSTGSGISWVAASGGGATLTNDTTTNATYYPTFSSATSGTYSTAYVSNTKCTFNPSTGTLSATVFTSLSDETQKTDIQPIENAISIVKQLQGVKYKWINDDNQPSIGVIAQEVEKVLPEVVSTNDNGLKSVSYGNIIGLLIEAIKEQQVCIEELKKKLNS
jgi:hypothetical protein